MNDKFISIELILKIIYEAIEEHNKINTLEHQLEKSLETIIHGKNSQIDSLGLINLLVDIESRVKKNINEEIILLDENSLLEENGPYQNVKSLSEFIIEKVKCQ